MIVGSGMIATELRRVVRKKGVIYFASGVSNSKELDEGEYKREVNLLKSYLVKPKKIVYFSTCSVADASESKSRYIKHKIKIEKLLINRGNYLIIRLPQVVGRAGSPSTIVNFIYQHIQNGVNFNVWKMARRNIVDVEMAISITRRIVESHASESRICTIKASRNISVLALVSLIEKIFDKTAAYKIVDCGGRLKMKREYFAQENLEVIQQTQSALARILTKYLNK